MTVFLGLGANQGDRVDQLELAIAALERDGFRVHRVSPLVESPAMLPAEAEASWDRPYLNIVVAGDTRLAPRTLLDTVKAIERELGREPGPRWSPRPIDIDILLWHDEIIREPELEIPHPGIAERDFVITPLLHIAPGARIPGLDRTVFELSLGRRNIPLWMGILNATPDSFSDGDSWTDLDKLSDWLDRMFRENIQVIDVGAESTRPNADTIPEDEEWRRLEPVLAMVRERIQGRRVRPLLSVDSRNPAVIARALENGIDIINDVTGLDDPDMLALARDSHCDVVAMHAMSVPVDPSLLLPADEPATAQMRRWIDSKVVAWDAAGIDLSRMIVDPGIGFGKTSIQAAELMSSVHDLRSAGQRLLIGHSRKSFMAAFTDRPAAQRDVETLGISLALAAQGADIIRVHQPMIHQRAYRAWSHVLRE